MDRILCKRVWRDLKKNFISYFALFALIVMGMYLVISIVGSAENVITVVRNNNKNNMLEDGEFTTYIPLEDSKIEEIEDKGVTLEKQFYLDYKLVDNSTVRLFANRGEINLLNIDKGTQSKNNKEIVLEKLYAKEHNLTIGDYILLGSDKYKITGIGTVPDYDGKHKDASESSVDNKAFGLAFVNKDEYERMRDKGEYLKSETYVYSYLLNGKLKEDELKDSIDNLISFTKSDDNRRIEASVDDVIINKVSGLVAGVVIMILFTYVISVTMIHNIEKESTTIGALYALGVKKNQLLRSYLLLPIIITFTAGIIGLIIGYSDFGVGNQMKETINYFSIPDVKNVYPIYLMLYGIIMPPIVAFIVNFIIINKKLSQPALKLIRNEKKESKVKDIKLNKFNFVHSFQIRQFLREIRSSFAIVLGMFIALLISMLSLNTYVFCNYISENNKVDTKYEYMYTLKYPSETNLDGEKCFSKTLKKEILGYNLDVNIIGIDDNNKYFDYKVPNSEKEIVISSSVANKYKLEKGEKLVLNDDVEDKKYEFVINDIVEYSVGLNVFMDIDSMRNLFGEDEKYYNVILSDDKLNINEEILYSTITKEDISKSSDVFIENMMPMVISLNVISIIVFIVVMYLMIKIMIERSAGNISLMKIFGYRQKEVKKLYLNGNFIMVILGALICIPIDKKLMDIIYPNLVANVTIGPNLTFSSSLYIVIFIAIIMCYLIINKILSYKLKNISPVEILKNRE